MLNGDFFGSRDFCHHDAILRHWHGGVSLRNEPLDDAIRDRAMAGGKSQDQFASAFEIVGDDIL
jgi:hypothetical protein